MIWDEERHAVFKQHKYRNFCCHFHMFWWYKVHLTLHSAGRRLYHESHQACMLLRFDFIFVRDYPKSVRRCGRSGLFSLAVHPTKLANTCKGEGIIRLFHICMSTSSGPAAVLAATRIRKPSHPLHLTSILFWHQKVRLRPLRSSFIDEYA